MGLPVELGSTILGITWRIITTAKLAFAVLGLADGALVVLDKLLSVFLIS